MSFWTRARDAATGHVAGNFLAGPAGGTYGAAAGASGNLPSLSDLEDSITGAGAASRGMTLVNQGYQDAVNYLDPYQQSGRNALDMLEQFNADPGAFIQNDPRLQFILNQGRDAITNSAAARGGAVSGGTLSALMDYNQQATSQYLGDRYREIMQQLGFGQDAGNVLANLAFQRGTANAGIKTNQSNAFRNRMWGLAGGLGQGLILGGLGGGPAAAGGGQIVSPTPFGPAY